MKIQDIIIVSIIVIVTVLIFISRFKKVKKDPCDGCPFAKNCSHHSSSSCCSK